MNTQIHTPSRNSVTKEATAQKLLITQREAAKQLGICENTLRKWKCPRYVIGRTASPAGRNVRYHMPDVMDWLKKARSC